MSSYTNLTIVGPLGDVLRHTNTNTSSNLPACQVRSSDLLSFPNKDLSFQAISFAYGFSAGITSSVVVAFSLLMLHGIQRRRAAKRQSKGDAAMDDIDSDTGSGYTLSSKGDPASWWSKMSRRKETSSVANIKVSVPSARC